jgi:hypothetical protein
MSERCLDRWITTLIGSVRFRSARSSNPGQRSASLDPEKQRRKVREAN